MTALADSFNILSIDHNFLVCSFIFSPFIIDNCNCGSFFRKGMKMKILLFFTIIYRKININIIKKYVPAIICWRTVKKIQISLVKSFGNCWVPRQISKAASVKESYKIQLPVFIISCFTSVLISADIIFTAS